MDPIIPLTDISVWAVAKVFVLIALFVYLLFTWVVVRQVNLMTKTLEVGFEAPIKTIATIHFIVAVGVLVLAFIIL